MPPVSRRFAPCTDAAILAVIIKLGSCNGSISRSIQSGKSECFSLLFARPARRPDPLIGSSQLPGNGSLINRSSYRRLLQCAPKRRSQKNLRSLFQKIAYLTQLGVADIELREGAFLRLNNAPQCGMPYTATVLPVMIASPGDVREYRTVARDVISEWNHIHSETHKTVMLPVGWDTHSSPELGASPQDLINDRVLEDCDLLIGIFWTRLGSPTTRAPSGTVEEIQRHVRAGKPAMVYFS
jgi:hypothetical protein